MCCSDSGSSSVAPAAPNYTPITDQSLASAKIYQQTSADQLDWAKQQYAQEQPTTQAYLQSMTANTNQQTQIAGEANRRYQSIYAPLQDKFANEATNYNSPARAQQASGAAMADVSNTFNAQRTSALSQLESFGIDPSQTRFGALDLGTRVSQAAATAAAGTGSRINSENTGLQLEAQAAGMGNQLAGQAATSFGGATSSGGAGVSSALNTSTTYGNLMGTASQWAGNANQSLGTGTSALNAGYSNALQGAQLNQKAAADESSGTGQLIGGALAVGAIAI